MRERYRSIARVEKTHGRRGEVVTVSVRGLPSLVRPGLSVALVPPDGRHDRWHTVTSCSSDGRSGQLVGLSGVSTLDEARALVGATLLACEADLPADLSLRDAGRLIGREVTDVRSGRRGAIAEVMRGPANDVWVVRDETGELLVPVVDEVVVEAGDEGPILVRPPEGLVWERAGGAL